MRGVRAIGFLGVIGVLGSSLFAAWSAPVGYVRTTETFTGDAFAVAPDGKVAVATANFGGGASIKVYASATDAQMLAAPLQVFTDPSYKAWGDLTFTDNDTLLFSENVDRDTVYRGVVSSGATTSLVPAGSIPNAAGIVQVGSSVYVVAANNPGSGALYSITGGVASAALTNIGTGYLGGLAIDSAGNFLLTDSNDPTFLGNAGLLRRYTGGFAALAPISLATGNGNGAYDVAVDTEGDIFVTTGSTLTQIPFGTSAPQQFGSSFTGFPFVTNLDYIGSGFAPGAGGGTLFVNAVFSDDGSILGITPIPEPGAATMLLVGAMGFLRRRRRIVAGSLAASLAGFAMIATPAHADRFYASQVIDRTIGANPQSGFTNPDLALGPPRGGGIGQAGIDVYSLGNGGSITLGFDTDSSRGHITNGPGADFVVFENAFYAGGEPSTSFAELAFVEVSSDGVGFARFPARSLTPGPVGPYGTLNPTDVTGLAGANPVYANVDENAIDPFDPLVAGGEAFDLDYLRFKPPVMSGMVDLANIRYVRIVDIIGDGSSRDALQKPIYDPTGFGVSGADIDSIAVINGVHLPEPAALSALGGLALLLVRRH